MVEQSIAGDAFTKVQGRLRDVYEVRLVILELLVSKSFAAPVLREKSDRVSVGGGGRCRVIGYGCSDGRFSCIGFW